MGQADRRASALEWRKLRSVFCDGHQIDPPFARLPANLQRKTIFEQRLKHKPAHDSRTGGAFRLRFNRIELRISPRRETLDWHRVWGEVAFAAGKHRICHVDKGADGGAGPSQSVARHLNPLARA